MKKVIILGVNYKANFMLNDKSQKALLASGWFPGRSVDISNYKTVLQEDGLPFFAAADNFMKEFNGLHIEFYNSRSNKVDAIIFDVRRAMDIVFPERITENYSKRVDKQITPIGTAFALDTLLLIAEDGALYGGYDNHLDKFGNTYMDGINFIINLTKNSKPEVIP